MTNFFSKSLQGVGWSPTTRKELIYFVSLIKKERRWDYVADELKEELSDDIGDTVGVATITSFDILDEER